MERDQFPPTSHCVMDLTFISALSTNAFGFILHLRVFFLSLPLALSSFFSSWSQIKMAKLWINFPSGAWEAKEILILENDGVFYPTEVMVLISFHIISVIYFIYLFFAPVVKDLLLKFVCGKKKKKTYVQLH